MKGGVLAVVGERYDSLTEHGISRVQGEGAQSHQDAKPGNNGTIQGDVMEIAAIQKSLATKAQAQPTHRFNDLYRYVRDAYWLECARSAIMSNDGANTPGIDGIKGQDLPVPDWLALLNQTVEDLRTGTYCPMPVKRVYIPKASGKLRPLGIIRDRMVQEAIRMILEPIYESHFLACSNGFRPGRATMTAIHTVQRLCNEQLKYFWIVEGDLKGCFDAIPHDKLIHMLRKVIADERLLSLIWSFLKAGYIEENILYTPKTGTPQGGIASPILANIYLHEMDIYWWKQYGSLSEREKTHRRRHGQGNVNLVRYADDFLVLTNGSKSDAERLKEEFGEILNGLELTLSSEKTLVTHVNDGFEFLGFHVQRRPKLTEPERKALYVTPTKRNIERYKEKIRKLLSEPNVDPVNKIRAVNRVLKGWAIYYQHVQSSRARRALDHWTFRAVWKWLQRKHGGELGEKAIYRRYASHRDHTGQKALGYGTAFLARMNDASFKRYRLPKGGITNPYLITDADISITGDEPIQAETWNGLSAQNRYALARQDLLVKLGPICQRCGQQYPSEELHAHHVKARKDSGQHKAGNLQLLCQKCHAATPSYGQRRRKDVTESRVR
jgi:RNA-directed DNA polymerase